MYKFIPLVMAAGASLYGQAQFQDMIKFDQLAPKASKTVEVNLDGNMLSFVRNFLSDTKKDEAEAKRIIGKLKGIYVRSLEFDKPGQFVCIPGYEWSANTALCRSMGITRLPTVQFFNGRTGEKIGSLAAGPSKFAKVQQALDHYLSLQAAELDFEADMEQGKALMDQQLESGKVFEAQNPAVVATRENAKQLVMSSESNNNNNVPAFAARQQQQQQQQQHERDTTSAAWWNVRSILAKRRARRDASLLRGGGDHPVASP